MKRLGIIAAMLALCAALFWWMIGSDWRSLILNAPTGNDVLFWDQGQREAGFRMLDRVPMITGARDISDAPNVRALDAGSPIDFEFDIDTYMDDQRHVSMVILHEGKIRFEAYKMGFSETGRWTSFSVAKSLTSTLVGAAIKDGYIQSLDDPVSNYVKGLQGSAYDDVTIEQLLKMSSGVRWTEIYDDPTSDVARFVDHVSDDGSPNVVNYLKGLPRAHPPGEVWNYSTGETNLIGILVSEATGKQLADYLSEKIWKPYGMQQKATWLLNDDGTEISGCCIQAATRDFARFGQFMLEGAQINGESIVPDGWIEAATKTQIEHNMFPNQGYGFQWWTHENEAYEAMGIFGQGIYIDPQRDLVIASNSSWTTAIGDKDGESAARQKFYNDVTDAIDAEAR